jgi:hypothetical protein
MKNKRLNNPANPIQLPMEKNVEWAMDFMSDALSNGRRIRTLNIVDQYNRQCLHIAIDHSISAKKVIDALEVVIEEYDGDRSHEAKLQKNMLHNRYCVYLGMHLGKYMQKGRQSNLPPSYFRRNNLSLAGCSPAEPTSVLIEHSKIQSKLLYLQSVKISDHLQ